MSAKFVVGQQYYPADSGYEPVTVVRRTEKYITVRNSYNEWRMLVRTDEHDVEYARDSSYSGPWQESFTYRADNWDIKEREN